MTKYIIYTQVASIRADRSQFSLEYINSVFFIHHDFEPGDKVKVTIEKIEQEKENDTRNQDTALRHAAVLPCRDGGGDKSES